MENILSGYLAKYISLSAEEKKAIVDLDIFKHYKKGTLLLKRAIFRQGLFCDLRRRFNTYSCQF